MFVHGFGCDPGMLEALVVIEFLVKIEVPMPVHMHAVVMLDMTAMHLRLRIERLGMIRAAGMANAAGEGRRSQHGDGDQRGGNCLQHGLLLSISIKKVTGRNGRAHRSCSDVSSHALNPC